MLKKCGLNKETFTEPYDCFRWGDILQSNGLCAHGFSFWGFIYHAANWGIALQREGNEFLIDRKKLKKFFSSCSEYLNHYTILNASNYMGILFHRGQQGLMAGFLNTFPQNEKRFEFLGQPLVKDGFSSQALFLVSMGKNTEYEDIVYDFFRFILMDHIQELFLSPEVNFSVIERIYRVQYKKISEMTCVNIPAFDLRGIYPMMDLDFLAFTQRYVHAETVEALLDFKNHDKVIESICRINIPERRRIFLETASQSFLKQYDPYIKYLKDSGEI